jgi:hypothetical protein
MDSADQPTFPISTRRRELVRLLADAGILESGTDAHGNRFENDPPEGLALILDGALGAQASTEHVVEILTWGQPARATPETWALAERIVALRDSPPA